MRSHRRRQPLQHVLLAGCADDLLMIQSVLAVLPADTYGQVLVETDGLEPLPVLDAPARVTVHQVCPGGADLALRLWAEEWLPHESDDRRTLSLWIGAGSSAHAGAVEHGLGALVQSL